MILNFSFFIYNLKNQEDYQAFFDSVIEDIESINPRDGQGYPLDDDNNRITVDWLWENYGHHLDESQTGLGYQLFNEIIKYYNEIGIPTFINTEIEQLMKTIEINKSTNDFLWCLYTCIQYR